MTLLINSISIS